MNAPEASLYRFWIVSSQGRPGMLRCWSVFLPHKFIAAHALSCYFVTRHKPEFAMNSGF